MVFATQWQDYKNIKEIGLQENGAIQNNKKGGDKQL